jgi:hypothetical protein
LRPCVSRLPPPSSSFLSLFLSLPYQLVLTQFTIAPRGFFLHPVLLAGFGMPIGELFDLERLSEYCEALGRWTFFFTSEPLNVIGGVASPPNALAIF